MKYLAGKIPCLCGAQKCARYIGQKYVEKEDSKRNIRNIVNSVKVPSTKKQKKKKDVPDRSVRPRTIELKPIDVTDEIVVAQNLPQFYQ